MVQEKRVHLERLWKHHARRLGAHGLRQRHVFEGKCRLPQHRDRRGKGSAQRGQWQSRARGSPSPSRGQLPCSPLLLPHIQRPAVGLGVRRHMFPHHNSLRRGDRLAAGEVLSLA
jgi:hypothetical protein